MGDRDQDMKYLAGARQLYEEVKRLFFEQQLEVDVYSTIWHSENEGLLKCDWFLSQRHKVCGRKTLDSKKQDKRRSCICNPNT